MPDDPVTRGLEAFAAGDFAAAADAWQEAREANPDDPQVEAYLGHLRQLAPDVVGAVMDVESRDALETSSDQLGSPAAAVTEPTRAVAVAEALEPPVPAGSAEVPGGAVALGPILPPPDRAEAEPAPSSPASGASDESVPTPVAETHAAADLSQLEVPRPAEETPSVAAPAGQEASASPIGVAGTPIAVPVPEPPAPTLDPIPGVTPESQSSVAGPWAGEAVLGPAIEVRSSSAGLALVAAPEEPASRELVQGELAREEAELKELLELDDFSGALALAEQILQSDPEHPLATTARDRCRETLQQIYRSKIGDLAAVPQVLVAPEEVIWLDLDHRSGFLLAQVDGASTYEEIIELGGMEVLESLRLMATLVQKGVIGTG